MNRAESYYNEIRTICSEHERCLSLKTAGKTLRFTLSSQNGKVNVWWDFFADTVIVIARHSRKVASELLPTAMTWLNECNMYHGSDAYGVSSGGDLTFMASYDLRYRSPRIDPGLDGFCTLVLETVPDRLDRIVGLMNGIKVEEPAPCEYHSAHTG